MQSARSKGASSLSDEEIIDRATRLTITIYRDERLSGHIDIGVLDGMDFHDADAIQLIRELLAAFERKPAVFKSNTAGKVVAV